MKTNLIDTPVHITAVSFNKKFMPIPRRIEYGGTSHTFVDAGMRYLIKQGEDIIRLWDMTDGQARYRLRCDAKNSWRLMSITQ